MLKLSALVFTLLLQLLRVTKSTVVIDKLSQKGLYLSEYCPKMKYCAEGAHVMCMYYNPHHVMGPACSRPKNVSITPQLSEKLLEVTNAIRSKVALGKEKGKGGVLLPRAYGMNKLKWDSELATFAQVLANQCVLKHDLCRASKKFPDPGQTAGLVRFTFPDWIPVSKSAHLTKPGLTYSKLSYAITQSLKTWYVQKESVTPEMVTNYPDWTENPTRQNGKLYMEMIYGSTTHMGCGISAYSYYVYHDNTAALNYNAVNLICNFSSRAQKGTAVYNMEPPSEEGYTVKCGCPVNMDEDTDCLCSESMGVKESTRSCSESGHCKPAVVLLPIFTVENAPPEKLIARSGFDMSPFEKKEHEEEISDLYGPADNTSVVHPMEISPQTNIQSVLGNIINAGFSKNDQLTSLFGNPLMLNHQVSDLSRKSPRLGYNDPQMKEPHSVITNLIDEAKHDVDFKASTPHSKRLIHNVQKRVFGKHPSPQQKYIRRNTVRPTFNRFQRKKSVFSNVAPFELPKKEENIIKPDVKPRKDFSNVKNLVQDYLNFKKDYNVSRKTFHHPFENHRENLNLKTTTERFLNSAEDKVMNYNYYLNNTSQSINKPKGLSEFERSNDKLMNLLDKLEQEVKHIDMDKYKKEIFDAKIRKIYGTVVGEVGLINYKSDHESDFTVGEMTDFDKYESEHNRRSDAESKTHINMPHLKSDFEEIEKNVENIHEKYDYENEVRPISRSLNPLYMSKPSQLIQRNIKKSKEGYESDIKHPYSDFEEIRAKLHKGVYSSDNDIKSDHIYSDKENLRTRKVYSDTEDNKISKYPDKRKFRDDDDPLNLDRRRYYQSKLDNLEKKLHNTRSFKHHKDSNNRQIRPVLPTAREEQPLRPSKNQPDTFYMPDRARFLHGF